MKGVLKMAFKKTLLTFAAVGALSVAMAASAFAADTLTVSQDKDTETNKENGKVSITEGLENASGQMTVLIFAEGADTDDDGLEQDEILYIDQLAANGNSTFKSMGIRSSALTDGKLKAGNYTVLVGSDAQGASLLKGTLKVTYGGTTIQLGDCDGISGIDVGDVTAVLQHMAGTALLTGDAQTAADCDGIAGIDVGDVTAILQHMAGTTLLGTK